MKDEKVIVFDASTLISFAMNGLFEEIKKLKEIFPGKFIITKEVKKEMIDRPIKVKRFELEALRLNKLLKDGVLEMPRSLGINDDVISKDTNRILDITNKTFYSDKKDIHLIDLGEASCLALSRILSEEGIEHVLAVDERTTRMLCEKPENLQKLLQKKLHTRISFKKDNLTQFKNFKFIRSSELAYILYKNNLMPLDGEMVLDALLYAVKFKGCSISEDEIRIIKSIK